MDKNKNVKPLFEENGEYGDLALEVDQEVNALLRPVFDKYRDQGYKIRDISHIIAGVTRELECLYMIGWDN